MTVSELQLPATQNAVQQKINEIIANLGGGGANTDLSNLTATGEAHFLRIRGNITNSTVLTSLDTGVYAVDGITHSGFPDSTQAYYGVLIQYNGDYKPQLLVAGVAGVSGLYYRRYLTGSSAFTSWSTVEQTSNKVTSISSSSTDTQYPSAKLLYDQLALKENSLGFTPANQDLSNLSSTGKRVMDSGIVAKYAQLESATTTGSRTVNLSTYLPSNDTYLVYIRLTANYNSAEASYGIGNVQNPYTNRDSAIWYMGCAVSSSSRFSYLHCWVPVTNKTLYSQIYGGALKAGVIQAYGYRKVGTNS